MTKAVSKPHLARYPSLVGKVVFITGGGTGIGAALVSAFAAQQAQVAFVDIEVAASQALCDQLAAQGLPRPRFFECDLRNIAALQGVITEVGKQLGDVAVLVNNAANDARHRIEDVTPEFWDNGIAINQRPAFFAAQAVLAGMRRLGGGAIVNFGSVGWKLATGGYPVYATAKASTHGLTRALARDLGPDNIRVNTVVPGWVMTEKQLSLWVDDAARAEIAQSQCLKGQLLPEHLASMVLFLASDDATMCSAQEFTVDGGWV